VVVGVSLEELPQPTKVDPRIKIQDPRNKTIEFIFAVTPPDKLLSFARRRNW
jgi:hypothetical protein